MLEKPDLQDENIVACLWDEYGFVVKQITFLPLGADLNTAVYRIDLENGAPCFLKLRRGVFSKISVTLPKFFNDQGIPQVIPPLETKSGQL